MVIILMVEQTYSEILSIALCGETWHYQNRPLRMANSNRNHCRRHREISK